MAALVKSTKGVSLSTPLPPNTSKVSGFLAGENLVSGDTVILNASKQWVKPVADPPATVQIFIVLTSASQGEAITAWKDVTLRYGDSLPQNADRRIYASAAVAGGLDTTAPTVAIPVGMILDEQRVLFTGRI